MIILSIAIINPPIPHLIVLFPIPRTCLSPKQHHQEARKRIHSEHNAGLLGGHTQQQGPASRQSYVSRARMPLNTQHTTQTRWRAHVLTDGLQASTRRTLRLFRNSRVGWGEEA
ncbi:uncharacterized protein TrAFT101_009660 [Trichoderma asperellum]|uniref:uncharacterized protein n=1 Tax=Trichoderma asperellum TaxID=101201 RepID=UPI00331A8A49|nr:hypothetical protein TrAFT101_009660 [Trichoderma asperellum]